MRIPAPYKLPKSPSRDNLALIARALTSPFSTAIIPPVVASPVDVAPAEIPVVEIVTEVAPEAAEMVAEPSEAVASEPETLETITPAAEVSETQESPPVVASEETPETDAVSAETVSEDVSWDISMKKSDLLIIAANKGIALPPTATKTEILNALKGHTASA